MQPTFLETVKPMALHEFPKNVVISVDHELQKFLYDTGLVINCQEHHEITRQIFDYIDFGFNQFCDMLKTLPILKLLNSFSVDQFKYFDTNGNLNSLANNLKKATETYGIAIYMKCKQVGMFDGDRTPYIIESINNDLILLQNGYTEHNQ